MRLALINRAIDINPSIPINNLREIQIIILITFLLQPQNEQLIGQIKTGEGKALLIAALALYFRQEDLIVYIVTSNTVLAKRDAKEFQSFYSQFSIKSGNAINEVLEMEAKSILYDNIYQNEIIYGDVGSFQFAYFE